MGDGHPFSVRENALASYQLHESGWLDERFRVVRTAFLRGHLTLRETTLLQNHEVWLRKLERDRVLVARREAV